MEEPTSTPSRSSQNQEPCGYPGNAEAMISQWVEHLSTPLYTMTSIENNDHVTNSIFTITTPRSLKNEAIAIANMNRPFELDTIDDTNIIRPFEIDTIEDTNISSSLQDDTIGANIFTGPPMVTPPCYRSPLPTTLVDSLNHEINVENDHITNSIIATNNEIIPYDITPPTLLMDSLNLNNTMKEPSKLKVWRNLMSLFNPSHYVDNVSKINCIKPQRGNPQNNNDKKQSLELSFGMSPKSKAILPPLRKQDKRKKTLVLDLDETLVHTSFTPLLEYDFVVQVQFNELAKGNLVDVYVINRPGLEDFLQEMSLRYELVIFTASTKPYADAIMDQIDHKRLVKHRLYRDSCIFYDGALAKDLATLGRDLHKVIIVDNTPHCYSLQPKNAVPIGSFVDDKNDSELIQLIPFLSLVAEFDDVTISLNAIPRDFPKNEVVKRLHTVG